MLRWSILILTIAAAGAQDRRTTPQPAEGRRMALVVANGAYLNAPPLRNPMNDGRAIAKALSESGFTVQMAINADLHGMNGAVDGFVRGLRAGDVALFYYSGHGIQVEGENYLAPVDFHAVEEADVPFQAYSAGRVLERAQGADAALSIVILDACRDNPFRTTRSGAKGLAAMNTGRGAFIAFATSPGATASDNAGEANGLFTKHLLETLARPGLKLGEVFDQVRERVYEASGHKQLPWTASSVIGTFVFRDPAAERASLEAELHELERQIAARRDEEKERQAAALRARIAMPVAPAVAPAPENDLEKLRREVEARRVEAGSVTTLTLEEAQRGVATLDRQIEDVRKQYDAAREEALNRLPAPEKDQFETSAEFESRKQKVGAERAQVTRQYTQEFEKAVKPSRDRIAELEARTYPVAGAKADFVSYDADRSRMVAKLNGEEYAFAVPPAKAKSLYTNMAAVRVEKGLGRQRSIALIDPATLEKFAGDSAGTVNPQDRLRYLWIPAGTFAMGCSPGDSECDADEKPAHRVTLSRGFWLGQTPVTQEAYQKVTGQNPSRLKGAHLPVDSVHWDEAQAYCHAIGGRLPTEAEWEWAGRAGTTSARYGNLDDIAWYNGVQTDAHEVAQKRPNAFGLYDMLGNVGQWTADWYGGYAAGAVTDPAGPPAGPYRTLRGGWTSYVARGVRVSSRNKYLLENPYLGVGFRCAMEDASQSHEISKN